MIKKGKEKQKPFFSKVLSILEDYPSSPLTEVMPKADPTSASVISEARADFPTTPPVAAPGEASISLPDPQIISTKVVQEEAISPPVTPIPEELEVEKGSISPEPQVRSAEIARKRGAPTAATSEARGDLAPTPTVTLSEEVSISPPEDRFISAEVPQAEEVPPSAIAVPGGIEVVVNSLGMAFVLIPADSFIMGSPEIEAGRSNDESQHEVTISRSFYLQTTPVTQGQWVALMGHNPPIFAKDRADLPVEGVSWQDCQEFIKKLQALKEGTYRLPTEAEWEYACRAGSPMALANGDLTSLYCELDPALDEIGWYCGNSNRCLQPVAQKRSNAWGLYDMHGNLGEWCQDWYGPYPPEPQTDPSGPPSGPGRVVRGGSWFSSAKNCRAAARSYAPPNLRNLPQVVGFRLVKIV